MSIILYSLGVTRIPALNLLRVTYMLKTSLARKTALLLHVISSVGWLGSVAAYLVLSIGAGYSHDDALVRSACLGMNLLGWYAVVPLSLLAVATGLVQALGTPWGLFRYYWVIVKLVLTAIGTGLLLMHQGLLAGQAALAARDATTSGDSLRQFGAQLVWDSGLGLFLLIVLTGLSVFKPWGMTRRAARQQTERPGAEHVAAEPLPVSLKWFLVGVTVTLLVFAASHHMHGHHHS